MTDPIADMLTRIRNALAVRKTELTLPCSNLKFAIAQILVKEGYLDAAEKTKAGGREEITIRLRYNNNTQPAIHFLRRISTPGRHQYVGRDKLPYVLNDLGIAILSTSQGIMTNKQARKIGVGGELLCEIG